MAAAKAKVIPHSTPADTSDAVNAFMGELAHPSKADIESLRRAILAVDASVAEGIKWNAPSFRTGEYFATFNLRAKGGVALILHLGAKVRELPGEGVQIRDPSKLLKWLGKDRALVKFGTSNDVAEKAAALQAVLQQWIKYV